MLASLIEINAQGITGAPMTLRLASHDLPSLCSLGGLPWDAALIELPGFALDFFGGVFNGQITAPRTQFSCTMAGIAGMDPAEGPRAIFSDARVRVWAGDLDALIGAGLGPLTLRFDGRMTGEPAIEDGARIARFEAAVADSWADEPLLDLFAGTGGVEGPADLTGQPKPLVLGNAVFCRGVLIDVVDNVYMVSGGAVQAVNAVRDRVASLGASSGNHADLAALLAAEIAPGSWATCLALGLVRLGAPADGRISFDVSGDNGGTGGYVRLPGAMIGRIAEIAGGAAHTASLAALDVARPYNLALQIKEQTTAREQIQRIADSVAAVAGVSLTGKLFAQPLSIGVPAEYLAADGSSEIAVLAVEEMTKAAPAWRIATEAELTFEVHSADEAAFEYRWQGVYSATRVYRLDDVVTGPGNASWLYINAVPAAGADLPIWPATANDHWRNFTAPVDPVDIGVEPGATEGAVVPTPGSGESGNVKDEGGNLYDPGELLNASMELTPSGQLQFRPLPGSGAVLRGQITLPDIGAASEAALRRAEDDVDALANAVATALDEASRTRETFTDVGFFVDEATGQVRIHAVEQTTERLNTVDVRLDAAESNINLRATTSYVDQAIADAVLDPSQIADLDAIFVRLTAAELDIDGLEATVTTLATVTELTALTGRVTTAESELDALEGTVSTKVDTTTFNALETRVTSAETTLTALGDTAQIVNAVTSIRLIEREVDANAEGALAALVQDDRNQRDQVAAVASARQELRTEITDGLTAEATARLALQAEVANNAASLANESITRASEDAALASQISALEASTDTSVAALTASISAESTARTNADTAIAADITALEADLATETSQRTAAITAEQQARVDGDAAEAAARTALAARVTTAEADIDANTAAVTAEQTARATADSAIAASVTSLTTTVNDNSATLTTFGQSIDGLEARFGVRLDVNGRVTGFTQNNDGEQGNFILVADNFEILDPDLGPGGTPLTVFQILNGVISGSALNFDDVIGDNRPEDNADVTATAQRSIVSQFPIIEVRQYEAGNAGSRTVSHFAKRGETAIGGGTWSLPSVLLGAGTASIDSSTGLVTLSGVAQSGAYTVRYTHTDGGQTELPVNVTFIPQEATVRSISATPSIVTWFQSSTTSRTVSHVAVQGSTTLTGGTWSLVSTSGMTASINSSTGLVTVSNAAGNGNYRVRYTHTDTVETELVVNLTYYPASDPGRPTDPNYNEP